MGFAAGWYPPDVQFFFLGIILRMFLNSFAHRAQERERYANGCSAWQTISTEPTGPALEYGMTRQGKRTARLVMEDGEFDGRGA